MQNRDDGTMIVIAIVLLLFFGATLWVSRALGASFSSVCTTALSVLVVAGISFAAWRFLDDFAVPIAAGFLVIGWPTTWPVLDSIANGGSDTESYCHPMQSPFINSAWMTWGVEVIFVGLLGLAVYMRQRRRW
ncbi:hypothetical protein [Paraburkholderia sp. RL17-337-BIB-A]|uniref:hypothetical protein n=1 Tax=Paraburkholderia sp. RL17-337-BIB-A TaxID=3031636 RepID=UPI0038B6E881